MHYFRHMRNGHFGLNRTRKERIVDDRGYVTICADGHPLADKHGRVREHRHVYFEQVDKNPSACAMCKILISWADLHIDHRDDNPSNNDPNNLRALCRGCNVYRAHNPLSMGKNFLTANGLTLTAAAWARMPGVLVAGNTIMQRKSRGMSDHDAIFSPRRTRQSIKTKVLHKPRDALRGIASAQA